MLAPLEPRRSSTNSTSIARPSTARRKAEGCSAPGPGAPAAAAAAAGSPATPAARRRGHEGAAGARRSAGSGWAACAPGKREIERARLAV